MIGKLGLAKMASAAAMGMFSHANASATFADVGPLSMWALLNHVAVGLY